MVSPAKNRGGRPPLGAAAKSAPLSIKIMPTLKARIDELAASAERSVSEQVSLMLCSCLDTPLPEPEPIADLRQIVREETERAIETCLPRMLGVRTHDFAAKLIERIQQQS